MATFTPTSEDVAIYEFCILYPFPFGQKEESELLKGVEELFAEVGGKVLMKDPWGRRGLAYKIGGFMEGNYVIYYVELDPLKLKEIDPQMRILKGVLRHMVVKPPKNYQFVSYAQQFVKWQEDSKQDVVRKELDREDKLKKQVVDKAKRVKPPVKEKTTAESMPMSKETIAKELDKIISDDLNI